MRPLKNVRFCSSSRKAIISTTGIRSVFRGLKFEPNDEIGEIGQKGALCKGLMRPSGQKGFTIIELAIVLVIIGLIVGFGASLVVPLTIRAKRTESREILKAAKESIVGFAAANGRIPIWGDNISDTIAVDEFCEVITNRKDAFTQPLYYFPVDVNNQLQTPGDICRRKTTNLTVCRDPACISRVSNVAFVVATGSENVNPQTGIISPPGCPAGETCIGVYDIGESGIDNCTCTIPNLTPPPNCLFAPNCPNYDAAVNRLDRAEEYDDIVEWVTLNELKVRTGCQGPPLRIVSNELPYGHEGVTYSVTIYADGGVLPYTWSLVTAPPPAPGLIFTAGTAIISGTPTTRGAYNIRIQVCDNNDPAGPNDNCAIKSFVLTINPP